MKPASTCTGCTSYIGHATHRPKKKLELCTRHVVWEGPCDQPQRRRSPPSASGQSSAVGPGTGFEVRSLDRTAQGCVQGCCFPTTPCLSAPLLDLAKNENMENQNTYSKTYMHKNKRTYIYICMITINNINNYNSTMMYYV